MASDPAAARVKPAQSSRRNEWLFALVLLAVTLAAYYPAWFGKPLWDDDAHMTGPQLRSWTGLWRIWTEPGATQQYYPLVHSVFWLEYKIWGDSTFWYHLVNILLHVFCALLLLRILRLLEVPGAWLAAAIFALHPVEVESVAWISELKNTLSGAFYLGAALVYLRFDRNRERRLYFIAIGLFLLGLFSKTVIATLPAALLVVFWWKRGEFSWKRDVMPLIPFFVLGIAMGLLTAHVEGKYIIGDERAAFRFSVAQRFLIAGRAFWFYIVKLIWPARLVFIYPRWDVNPGALWQWLFPAAALALLAALWMLRKRTRAPLAAALFFGGTLFPALGFVDVYPFIYSFVADHFQYLAGIGIISLAAAGAALLSKQLKGLWKTAGHLFTAAVLVLLGACTWWQSRIYTSAHALYTTTLEQNPGCWMAWNNLGTQLLGKGDFGKAITYFQKAIALNPAYANAENNLGEAILSNGGTFADAVPHFQAALKILPRLPQANINLGNILRAGGHLEEAAACYKRALEVRSDYAGAYNGLGNIYYQKGDMDDALAEYQKALEIQPDLALTLSNAGSVMLRKGDVNEAMAYFQKALAADPHSLEALNNLAWLLSTADSSVRNGPKAVELAERANRLSGGNNARYLGTLAAAYAEAGQFPQAVDAGEHALRLATAAHDTSMVDVLNMELNFYRAGKPFHQTSR